MKNMDKQYPVTKYITLIKRRLIFRDGKYHGFYFYR